MKNRTFSLIRTMTAIMLSVSVSNQVYAQTHYTVDKNATPSATVFNTLEALRIAVGSGWQTGDVITVKNDDHTLTAQLDFGGSGVSIGGTGKISPGSAGFRFASTAAAMTVAPENGKTLQFDGFGLNDSGGVFRAGSADITLGTPGSVASLLFTSNRGTYGGAVDTNGAVFITGGINTFKGNTASARGGAIWGNTVSITGGKNTFTGNISETSQGGAVLVEYDGTFIAANGDMLFKGNLHSNDGGNSTTPNAIFAINNNNSRTLHLAATEGKSILFYDPIQSTDILTNLIIAINPDASHIGTVLFDTHVSLIYGNTNLHHGIMALKGGSVYGAETNIGSFNLKSGATLLSGGNNNQIQANNITLEAGSILSFDLTGAGASTLNLQFRSNNQVIGNPSVIDITAFNGNGIISLANKMTGTFADPGGISLRTRGESIANTRAAGDAVLTGGGTSTLQLISSVPNGVVTWEGNMSNIWNAVAKNWNTSAISGFETDERFLHGDAVVFDGSGGNIQIQNAGVQITERGTNPGMEVESGDWQFTGGEIEGGKIHFSGSGSIAFDTRIMKQRIEVDAGKQATISALAGETVTFRAFDSAGDGGVVWGGGTMTGIKLGNVGSTQVFEYNTADGSGGVIYGTYVNLTSGNNTFTGNSAAKSGGAIFGSMVTLNGGNNTFTGNNAIPGSGTQYGGGAIKGDVSVQLSGGLNTFIGNNAESGGAIKGNVEVTLSGGVNLFTDNTVERSGGAIAGTENVNIIGGANVFTGNKAGGNGGAIWGNGKGLLIAKDGDLTFKGNRHHVGTVDEAPNAIYMENLMGDEKLNLAALAGRKIELFDPIENVSSTNLPIDINQTGADPSYPAQEYKGTVLFDKEHSNVYGTTTVYNGTMALTGGAVYGASGNESFTLNNGATLSANTKKNGTTGNSIQANTVTFASGSTLSFDITDAVIRGNANATKNLTVIANNTNIAGVTVAFSGTLPALSIGNSITLIHASAGTLSGAPSNPWINYGGQLFALSVINNNELIATAAVATVPDAPQNFTATAGNGQIALSWTAPASDGGSAVTKYQVSHGTTAGYSTNWSDIPGSDANTVSYTVPGLTNGTEFTFEVRAVNAIGDGASSGTQTATPLDPSVAPTITSAASASVFYGDGGTFQVTATGTATISFTLTGAPAGVTINASTGLMSIAATTAVGTHTFTITASNGVNPDATQNFSLTVVDPPPPVPHDLYISVSGSGKVTADKTAGIYPGETVTLTVTPDAGHTLASITASGVTIDHSDPSCLRAFAPSCVHSFIMPNHDVTVTATFRAMTSQESWAAAKALIEANTFTLTQQQAPDALTARFALSDRINELIKNTGITITYTDIVIFSFTSATAGNADTPAGIAGIFEFRVSPSGFATSAYSSGTITPSPVANDVITDNPLTAYAQNGILYISGLKAGEKWSIYNILGTLIYTATVPGDQFPSIGGAGVVTIPLPARGIYIITTGNRTFKIVN